jgi:sugar O-acyltransferase (sialic acid O-acetyltransferase NeuD family)
MPAESRPDNLPPIAIVGAGGFGREVLMLLHQINQVQPTWQILGFYDDNPGLAPVINDKPYLGTLADLLRGDTSLALVLAVGDPRVKARLRQQLGAPQFYFPVLIHPSVANAGFQFNQIGEGCIICQSTIMTTNIVLGRHVVLNLGCTIGHDAVLGDFCSLMPQVNLGGGSQLQQGVFAGTNVTVLPLVRVGENSILGAGTVVTRDLPANCTAVGVPAKAIKQHEQ